MCYTIFNLFIIFIFLFGYLAIALEHYIKVNKTASAVVMAVGCWFLLFFDKGGVCALDVENALSAHLSDVSQIIFFLLAAMTLVELIDAHRGFKIVTDFIKTRSKKKMFWLMGIMTFFLSAVLDNLTTTILMISLNRKLISDSKEKKIFGSMVVIAANLGGVWTPIGDVTTTMLWIKGQITTINIIKALSLPAVVGLLIAQILLSFKLKGKFLKVNEERFKEVSEPGSRVIFFLGIGALLFVPVFKAWTGLTPFMGMLFGLGVLWVATDLMHHEYENRQHLRIPHILTKIDTSAVLFFLGILLAVNALDVIGALKGLASYLSVHLQSITAMATIIGFLSAVIDNVPLVAACMGMYDLAQYPTDSFLWQMIALTAGTGGSIFVIGSAAGVALMALEKVDFVWYMKKISWVAILSYLATITTYLIIQGKII